MNLKKLNEQLERSISLLENKDSVDGEYLVKVERQPIYSDSAKHATYKVSQKKLKVSDGSVFLNGKSFRLSSPFDWLQKALEKGFDSLKADEHIVFTTQKLKYELVDIIKKIR